MYICVINNSGETVFHKKMECSRDNLELVTNTFEKNSVKKNVSFSDECSQLHMLIQKKSVQYAIFSEDGSSLSDSAPNFPFIFKIQIISTI